MAKDKTENEHYVKNADFSSAVYEWVAAVNLAKEAGEPKPMVTRYIAECFLKICEGLSHKANFVRYTFREEMVMDGVENCLRAINNYDITKTTRTGKPNAFSYFTQISWYAFLRRIQKEKRQQEIKIKFINQVDIESLIASEIDGDPASKQTHAMVEEMRQRVDAISGTSFEPLAKKDRKKRIVTADSDLTAFIFEENDDV
jgi:hypothetical protein